MGTGLLLGLVLPSPALQGVGWPGLRARQEPGTHVSPAGMGTPGGGRLVRARGDFHEWRPGRVGEACLGAAYLRRPLTKGYSKAHWAQILSSQPAWSPGHIDPARLPGWEEPTVQRPISLGHRMPSEPDPPGSGPRRPGGHLLRWQSLPISLLPRDLGGLAI